MGEQPARGAASSASESSPLIPPPSEIDIEAGAGDQFQCRICLETDGTRRSTPPLPPARRDLIVRGGSECFVGSVRVCVGVCREGFHRAVQVQGDVQVRPPRLPRPLESREGMKLLIPRASSLIFPPISLIAR